MGLLCWEPPWAAVRPLQSTPSSSPGAEGKGFPACTLTLPVSDLWNCRLHLHLWIILLAKMFSRPVSAQPVPLNSWQRRLHRPPPEDSWMDGGRPWEAAVLQCRSPIRLGPPSVAMESVGALHNTHGTLCNDLQPHPRLETDSRGQLVRPAQPGRQARSQALLRRGWASLAYGACAWALPIGATCRNPACRGPNPCYGALCASRALLA